MKCLLLLCCYISFSANRAHLTSSASFAHQESTPEDAFQRGLAALGENRLEDALAEFNVAERDHPDDARIRNFRGILLARMGNNAEASAEYLEAIRLNPLLADAYRNLGFLQWTEHQLPSARETLQRALRISPKDSFAHYYLGRVELDAQQYQRALNELDLSQQPFPRDIAFLLQVTTGYIALGRREDARKSLDELTKLPLDDAQSLQAASLLLSIQQNSLAISVIQQLVRRAPPLQARWAQFDLALTYLLAGEYEKTIEQALAYTEAVRRAGPEASEAADAWSLIGIAYAHNNQGERSVEALRQAATLAPSNEEHWLNLTRELMELNRYSEAITAVRAGITGNPKSYALHLRLGAAYLAAGRYPEAETTFRELVVAGDPLPTGYVGLAQVLIRTGRAQEASAVLAAAEKKLGSSFLLCYFRGLALDRAGKPSDAAVVFQHAVQLDPHNAEAHLNLGKTELTLGDTAKAIAELAEAVRLDSGNIQAKRLLSQAYQRSGDTNNATKYAQASAEVPVAATSSLVSDFFTPSWQRPPDSSAKK